MCAVSDMEMVDARNRGAGWGAPAPVAACVRCGVTVSSPHRPLDGECDLTLATRAEPLCLMCCVASPFTACMSCPERVSELRVSTAA